MIVARYEVPGSRYRKIAVPGGTVAVIFSRRDIVITSSCLAPNLI